MTDPNGHPAILKGRGGILPLVLEPQPLQSGIPGQPLIPIDRRVPLGPADDRLIRQRRQQRPISMESVLIPAQQPYR